LSPGELLAARGIKEHPHLPLEAAALVLLAAVCHAAWNTLVKVSGDRLVVLAIVNAAALVPCLAALPWLATPLPASWPFLALSALIHLGYYFFLVAAYRHGDLSHVYPIARGLSPLLVACGAALLVGERLAAVALAGMVLISTGLASLAFERGSPWRGESRGLGFAAGTAVLIACYTVVDGMGVRRSGSAASYVAWLFVLDGVPLLAFVAVRRAVQLRAVLAREWRAGLAGGALQLAAYGLVIWAMSVAPLAAVSALRETSVIFAALIGTKLLGEPLGRTRVAAACLVTVGVIAMRAGL
jgi:drug/metabolite transporter (DMT)-like permease